MQIGKIDEAKAAQEDAAEQPSEVSEIPVHPNVGIGVVTGDPGRPTGIAAECKIAELLEIEINSVNYFKSMLS